MLSHQYYLLISNLDIDLIHCKQSCTQISHIWHKVTWCYHIYYYVFKQTTRSCKSICAFQVVSSNFYTCLSYYFSQLFCMFIYSFKRIPPVYFVVFPLARRFQPSMLQVSCMQNQYITGKRFCKSLSSIFLL